MRHSSELAKASYSGKPGASSEYSSQYGVANAFQPDLDKFWTTKGNGVPATVWYHFDYTFTLARISFSPRPVSWAQVPKTFDVIGSDDCSNWHVLKSVTNSEFSKSGQTKSWDIPCESQKPYECYGIRATRTVAGGSMLSLTNIQMSQRALSLL